MHVCCEYVLPRPVIRRLTKRLTAKRKRKYGLSSEGVVRKHQNFKGKWVVPGAQDPACNVVASETVSGNLASLPDMLRTGDVKLKKSQELPACCMIVCIFGSYTNIVAKLGRCQDYPARFCRRVVRYHLHYAAPWKNMCLRLLSGAFATHDLDPGQAKRKLGYAAESWQGAPGEDGAG